METKNTIEILKQESDILMIKSYVLQFDNKTFFFKEFINPDTGQVVDSILRDKYGEVEDAVIAECIYEFIDGL